MRNAASFRMLKQIVEDCSEDVILVVSAMGKTTNAMEAVVDAYFTDKPSVSAALEAVQTYHFGILRELFPAEGHPVYERVRSLFEEVRGFLAWNKSPKYNFVYDQVVGYGELLSTVIVSAYLNDSGIRCTWLDIRNYIKTDSNYRDVSVIWEKTQSAVSELMNRSELFVTQGFLGSDDNNFTTTLGREGSDYTAAIIAYCLNAESVTIWKDVPGVLNADPRYFEKTTLLQQISYREAIELAFYGASVIHPKTLQPLQRKEIPLYVKSFLKPRDPGTVVGKGKGIQPEIPCFILKKDQVLMKLSSLDFSFIVEDNISDLFKLLHDHRMKVDLIQNSAISFSVCFDDKYNRLEALLSQLKGRFKVVHQKGVSLYTIRHFDPDANRSLQDQTQFYQKSQGMLAAVHEKLGTLAKASEQITEHKRHSVSFLSEASDEETVRNALVGSLLEQLCGGEITTDETLRRADELGIELLESNARGDDAQMVTMVETAIEQQVDAIIIDHGRTDTLQSQRSEPSAMLPSQMPR